MTKTTNSYLTKCNQCGGNTSRTYARKHVGKCKSCAEGTPRRSDPYSNERRNALIIDSGWQAYAREEGHYDIPDSY